MAAFAGLTQSQLETLQANTLAAINAILTGAQSYSMSGRSFTKADLGELKETLAEINADLAALTGTRSIHAYAQIV